MGQAPRIAFAAAASSIGGTERLLCVLSRQFALRNWNVRTLVPPSNATVESWYQEQGVTVEPHQAILNINEHHSTKTTVSMMRLFRSLPLDVVNIHYGNNFIPFKDIIGIRLGNPRIKCIAHVNHPTPWDEENAHKRKMTRLAGMLCHHVGTISVATQQVLINAGIPKRKITIIRCGVQKPSAVLSKDKLRQQFGIPEDAMVIGTLTRLEDYKRIDLLIEAVARLNAPPRPLLVIAGEGAHRRELEKLAQERLGDRAIFTGRVASSDDFYAMLDVFALPSTMEGFGLVYVEAAFHGVPSVGTNVGGIPDAITHGETGLLVPVGEVDGLVDALRQLTEDPRMRNKIGEAARIRAENNFTETHMADDYENIFRQLGVARTSRRS